MPDLPTRVELFEVFRNDLLARAETRPVGRRITATEIDTPGSDINLIGGAASALAEEVIRQLGRSTSDLTLDGAQRTALDRWVADRYSPYLARKTASRSRVTLQLTRTSTAAGAVNYNAGSIVRTTGGVRFSLDAVAAFGALSLGPVTVQATAVDAGTSGNVADGTITEFVTAPPDATMLVTNPDVAAGGDFTETAARLRARARSFYGAARRGILAAIEFGALTVPGVRQAYAQELLNNLGVQTGFIDLYIADANGQSNSILNAAVLAALEEYRAGGAVVTVYGAVPVYQSVEFDLTYQAGIDTVAAFEQVRASTVARVNSLRPGATLYISELYSIAISVNGVIAEDSSVAVPTGDVVPTAGQVIRTRNDLVNPSSP